MSEFDHVSQFYQTTAAVTLFVLLGFEAIAFFKEFWDAISKEKNRLQQE